MSVLDIIGAILSPVTDLISEIIPDKDKQLEIQKEIHNSEVKILDKFLDLEKQLIESKTEIITAEAKGESWLQRSWRPITMLCFLGLLFLYWFDVHPDNLTQETIDNLFTLLDIGIGGYIVSRGAEKVLPKILKK